MMNQVFDKINEKRYTNSKKSNVPTETKVFLSLAHSRRFLVLQAVESTLQDGPRKFKKFYVLKPMNHMAEMYYNYCFSLQEQIKHKATFRMHKQHNCERQPPFKTRFHASRVITHYDNLYTKNCQKNKKITRAGNFIHNSYRVYRIRTFTT